MAPRAQTAGNTTLRNRNRVTNKTRLKVIKGNIDADPIVLDEDEERARVVSTAGVDAEDANEHHLQAVLSAASHRATTLAQKALSVTVNGDSSTKNERPSTAFIPVPDAAGIVENYNELYPPNRWVDYISYIKFSDTVDEWLLHGLNDGFTYFMDERDAEWLEKNNQEARGEGTSAQASAAPAGTTTRSGSRTTKSKGKEADTNTPVPMNEDEFELVMGLFEKITHDNTPFLHVSFQQQQGACIPAFSEYHDAFANELPKSHFARYMHPSMLPPPSTLVRMAKTVYPYWRERKIEREGQRIIPNLNFDESDTKNESYICFRRRDTKAIRKTRTAQVSSAEKLQRLKGELGHATDLARNILAREMHKKEANAESRAVWEKRVAFIDLKRKHPALAGKDDEDVLIDKERPPKKPKAEQTPTIRIKSRPPNGDNSASPTPAEPRQRPKDRHADIQAAMDVIAKRIKEMDHGWDDQIDSSYQQPPVPLSDRFFKLVSEDGATAPPDRSRRPLVIRLRRGRGGRIMIDRRHVRRPGQDGFNLPDGMSRRNFDLFARGLEARRLGKSMDSPEMRKQLLAEDEMSRLRERWRFDTTGESTGTDEEDRVLFDDYDPRHMRISAMLASDADPPLLTDNRIQLYDAQTGHYNYINPVKPLQLTRREPIAFQQPRPVVQPGTQSALPQSASSQPVPVAQSVTSIPNPLQSPIKISAPTVPQHAHTPSNGPQRPPSSTSVGSMHGNANQVSSSPPMQSNANHVNGLPSQSSPVNGVPSLPVPSTNIVNNGNVNGMLNGMSNTNGLPNGFPTNLSGLTAQQQQAILLHQKQQNMQKFYANYMQRNGQSQYMMNGATAENINAAANLASAVNSANLLGSVNMNLKLPAARHMQWTAANQRSQSAQGAIVNGNDPTMAMQSLQSMQNLQNMQNMQQLANLGLLQSHNLPVVNGLGNSHLSPPRSAHSPPNALGHPMSLSPHMGSPAQSLAQVSPSRNMQTPVPPSPSPLLQHQVPNLVGSMTSQNQGF